MLDAGSREHGFRGSRGSNVRALPRWPALKSWGKSAMCSCLSSSTARQKTAAASRRHLGFPAVVERIVRHAPQILPAGLTSTCGTTRAIECCIRGGGGCRARSLVRSRHSRLFETTGCASRRCSSTGPALGLLQRSFARKKKSAIRPCSSCDAYAAAGGSRQLRISVQTPLTETAATANKAPLELDADSREFGSPAPKKKPGRTGHGDPSFAVTHWGQGGILSVPDWPCGINAACAATSANADQSRGLLLLQPAPSIPSRSTSFQSRPRQTRTGVPFMTCAGHRNVRQSPARRQ